VFKYSVFSLFVQRDAANGVIDLSSDDEIPPDILQVIPHGPMDFTVGSTSATAMKHLPNLGMNKAKGKALANGSSKKSATAKSKASQVLVLTGSHAFFPC